MREFNLTDDELVRFNPIRNYLESGSLGVPVPTAADVEWFSSIIDRVKGNGSGAWISWQNRLTSFRAICD